MSVKKVEREIAAITDDDVALEDIEIRLLLEAIFLRYGYDFRSYSKASVKRRVMNRLGQSGMSSISEMMNRVLVDHEFFVTLLNDLTVNVTEMFRDPPFYQAFRELVVPELRSYPYLKIWHAGCATGEEIYSMAILLQEEGLYDRTQIYATDIDKNVLAHAKKGIYSVGAIRQYSDNYVKAGGTGSLSDYYHARYDSVMMDQNLKRNVVFADHDLATDQVFGEMQVIICRNVLIYFDQNLQRRVFKLFNDSLDMNGFLCLGTKESMRFSGCEEQFSTLHRDMKIYRKKHL